MYPHIICHIMSSVDGRLQTERWTLPAGGADKASLMGTYAAIGRRLGADAWMFGKNTLREACFPRRWRPADTAPASSPVPYVAPQSSPRLFVVADPDADILYDAPTVRGDHIAAILPESAPAAYLERLRRDGISYLFAGPAGTDLRAAMRTLAETFGVRTLSLQGGGVIDGAFLQARLLDELSLVVYPGIDGAPSAPTVFEYIGPDAHPAAGQQLSLQSVEALPGGAVWLRYRFHRDGEL